MRRLSSGPACPVALPASRALLCAVFFTSRRCSKTSGPRRFRTNTVMGSGSGCSRTWCNQPCAGRCRRWTVLRWSCSRQAMASAKRRRWIRRKRPGSAAALLQTWWRSLRNWPTPRRQANRHCDYRLLMRATGCWCAISVTATTS